MIATLKNILLVSSSFIFRQKEAIVHSTIELCWFVVVATYIRIQHAE